MSEKNNFEQYVRKLLFLSNIPFIRVPLLVIGITAMALKTAETAKKDLKEKRNRTKLEVSSDNVWVVDE
jgi:hypothetical protein